uniref:Whey acidic protein n=1 Tax=Ornithorhynchus anatinus TaxID=9258 RepID=A0A6I8NP56_ORNAN
MQSACCRLFFLGLLALATATAPDSEKAGTCPVSVPEDVDQKDCKQLCDKDSICPEKTKCCMVGCSRQCVAPVPEKAGECPKPLTWVAQPCTEKSECADDLECGDDSKCCFNGCAKKCIPPYKGSPPAPSHAPTSAHRSGQTRGTPVSANPRLALEEQSVRAGF